MVTVTRGAMVMGVDNDGRGMKARECRRYSLAAIPLPDQKCSALSLLSVLASQPESWQRTCSILPAQSSMLKQRKQLPLLKH